jgi:hypothetical protein
LKGDVIPPEHSLALHCQPGPGKGIEVGEDGNPKSITRDAFRVDDDGISTNWIEFGGGDFAAACLLIAATRKVRKTHYLGVMNVGLALGVGTDFGKILSAVHDPIEPPEALVNPGHALLVGVASDDSELLDGLTLLVALNPVTDEAVQYSRSLFGK